MPCCTFFGHRDTPREMEEELVRVLLELIEKYAVDTFYVGNQGNFDHMVIQQLRRLKKRYTHIRYAVVLAYMPTDTTEVYAEETIYPEGLETIPPKFAIIRRNEWMIDRANFVVTCVVNTTGGAAKFKKLAVNRKKIVIELNA